MFPGVYFGFSPKIARGTHVQCLDVLRRISLANVLLESNCSFLPNRAGDTVRNTKDFYNI